MNIDLNAASNLFGALSGEVRARLMAAIERPGEETWDDAHSIILNRDVGLGLTLWQAVIKVDPAFASVPGPMTQWVEDSGRGGHYEPVSGWSRTPSADVIRQAINYATR